MSEYKIIKAFPNYSINKQGEVKNNKDNKLIKTFNGCMIDLYRDEGETVKDKKTGKLIKIQTRHRQDLCRLVAEHFHFCSEINIDNFIIKHKKLKQIKNGI